MKLKDKIRDKLRLWLLEDDLFQVEAAKKSYKDAIEKCKEAEERCRYANIQLSDETITYKNSYKLVDDCHKMVNSMVDIGTDVGFYSDDHSWAVVCIKGHPEYVKFIPLSHRDAHEVLKFLKHFKYSDRVIDSPFAFRDMVDRYIMENPFEK